MSRPKMLSSEDRPGGRLQVVPVRRSSRLADIANQGASQTERRPSHILRNREANQRENESPGESANRLRLDECDDSDKSDSSIIVEECILSSTSNNNNSSPLNTDDPIQKIEEEIVVVEVDSDTDSNRSKQEQPSIEECNTSESTPSETDESSVEEIEDQIVDIEVDSDTDEKHSMREELTKDEKDKRELLACLEHATPNFTSDVELLAILASLTEGRVRYLCSKYRRLFSLAKDGKVSVSVKLSVCQQHISERGCQLGRLCCLLHVCSAWLEGDCDKDDEGCEDGHSFKTVTNAKILDHHEIGHLSDESVKKLVKPSSRNGSSILQLCRDYFDGKCNLKSCNMLHICPGAFHPHEHFPCDGGRSCERNHKMTEGGCLPDMVVKAGGDAKAVLAIMLQDDCLLNEWKNFKTWMITDDEDGDVEVPEICCDFLEVAGCINKLCKKLHAQKRYHWQIWDEDSEKWLNLLPEHSDELEEAYGYLDDAWGNDIVLTSLEDLSANYAHNMSMSAGVNGSLTISEDQDKPTQLVRYFETVHLLLGDDRSWVANFKQFDDMKLVEKSPGTGELKLRRLGTPSRAVCKNEFATTYAWYFPDDNGRWVEYGSRSQNAHGVAVSSSEIDSATIEAAYISGDGSSVTFKAGKFDYEMDFEKMVQTNKQTNKDRAILRRPKMPPRNFEPISAPPNKYWEAMDTDELVRVVDVDPNSVEYKEVMQLFTSKGGIPNSMKISKICRIQNQWLWSRFQAKKETMQSNQRDLNEQQLFHGTESKALAPISREGRFTWKLAGSRVGAIYGQGVYFGTTPVVSLGYSKEHVIVSKVLVGKSILGDRTMINPPSPFDSTSGPEMFVIYEEDAIYPEYFVYY